MAEHDENTLRIAFLACDKVPEEVQEAHGEYIDVIHNLFEPHMPPSITLSTLNFDVVHKRHYPSASELKNIDAIVISGSFEDDAHSDCTWILRLAGFLIFVADDHPRIRIIGICFGLQIMARAFGPTPIIKNPNGWEVGATEISLTDIGKRVFWGTQKTSRDGDTSDLPNHVTMQQIHSDMVESVPFGFTLLGHSSITPVQAIAKFYSGDPPAFTHTKGGGKAERFRHGIHMIAFQGHPEWDDCILGPLIDAYEADGTYDPAFAEEARKRAAAPNDGDAVGRVILKVLGMI